MISVIIPLYNKGTSIYKTLYSILSQTYNDYEIIVIDDGSTDNGPDKVRSINNKKIKLVTQQNQGVSAARNRGIKESAGEWILFLDADDLLMPYALQVLYVLVKRYDVLLGCGNYYNHDKQGFFYKYIHSKFKGVTCNINKNIALEQVFIRTGNSLFNKCLFVDNKFNESLRRYEDLELFMKLSHNKRVAITQIPVMIYNFTTGGLAKNFSDISRDYLGQLNFEATNKFGKFIYAQMLVRENKNYQNIDLKSLYPKYKVYFWLASLFDIFIRIRRRLYRNLTRFIC